MSNEVQNPKSKYDLEERTAKFAEEVIDFLRIIQKDEITRPIISQLIRSITSIGANYVEADGAESKKDFKHKIAICKKEAKETKHWLRMLARVCPNRKEQCRRYWQEAQELSLTFASILMK